MTLLAFVESSRLVAARASPLTTDLLNRRRLPLVMEVETCSRASWQVQQLLVAPASHLRLRSSRSSQACLLTWVKAHQA